MAKKKRVTVEWTDSTGPPGGRTTVWTDLANYDSAPSKIVTSGYIVKEKHGYIVVASSISSTGHVAGLMTIPKSAITKLRKR
jgi:hypothetical protein